MHSGPKQAGRAETSQACRDRHEISRAGHFFRFAARGPARQGTEGNRAASCSGRAGPARWPALVGPAQSHASVRDATSVKWRPIVTHSPIHPHFCVRGIFYQIWSFFETNNKFGLFIKLLPKSGLRVGANEDGADHV